MMSSASSASVASPPTAMSLVVDVPSSTTDESKPSAILIKRQPPPATATTDQSTPSPLPASVLLHLARVPIQHRRSTGSDIAIICAPRIVVDAPSAIDDSHTASEAPVSVGRRRRVDSSPALLLRIPAPVDAITEEEDDANKSDQELHAPTMSNGHHDSGDSANHSDGESDDDVVFATATNASKDSKAPADPTISVANSDITGEGAAGVGPATSPTFTHTSSSVPPTSSPPSTPSAPSSDHLEQPATPTQPPPVPGPEPEPAASTPTVSNGHSSAPDEQTPPDRSTDTAAQPLDDGAAASASAAPNDDAVKCIFLCEFHATAGPTIAAQVPDDYITKEVFDTVNRYIIPKLQLQRSFLSVSLLGQKILGYPVRIDNKQYARNAFYFNFCFVFAPTTRTVVYEPVVRKLTEYMISMEQSTQLLSQRNDPVQKARLSRILGCIRNDLNKRQMCMLQEGNTIIPLCVVPFRRDAPVILPHTSAVLNSKFHQHDYSQWDLTTMRILPYVNGLNHVARISALSDVALALVIDCVKHLVLLGVAVAVPVFQYNNVYRPTPKLAQLAKCRTLQQRCLQQCSKSGRSRTTVRDVFRMFASMAHGATFGELCVRCNPAALNINEKQMVLFGLVEGLIRRVDRFPVTVTRNMFADDNNNSTTTTTTTNITSASSASFLYQQRVSRPLPRGENWTSSPVFGNHGSHCRPQHRSQPRHSNSVPRAVGGYAGPDMHSPSTISHHYCRRTSSGVGATFRPTHAPPMATRQPPSHCHHHQAECGQPAPHQPEPPSTAPNTNTKTVNPPPTFYNGLKSLDEICCSRGISCQQLEQQLARDRHVIVLLK